MRPRLRVLTITTLCYPMLSLLAACQLPAHETAKVDAERQWKHVRARVKLQLAEQQFAGFAFEEAIKTATAALELDPMQADAHVLLARAHLELGQSASAEASLHAAERAGLRSAELHYTRGVLHEQRGQFEPALERFELAFALDSINSEYVLAQAEALVALDRADAALALLVEQATRVNDEGGVALAAGRIALLLGDEHDAIRWLRAALATKPDDRALADELGLLLVRAERYPEAMALLKPASGDSEMTPAARRGLAACHLALDDSGRARDLLMDYARQHPSDVTAQLILAQAAIGEQNNSIAAEALDRAERYRGPRAQIMVLRGALSWQNGALDEARGFLRKAIAEDPDNVEAHCLMAEVLGQQQEMAQAQAHFRRALEIDPQSAWARRGLGSGS